MYPNESILVRISDVSFIHWSITWRPCRASRELPHDEFWPFFGPLLPLALDLPQWQERQEELPGMKNKRKQRKQRIEENQDKQK